MDYQKLNNGVKIPMIGFGTYLNNDPNECKASIREALNSGYRLFDTAQAYGNEAIIGEALKESGIPRSEIFITTKVWFHNYKNNCKGSVIESMKNLGVEYLDMVLLHWPFGDTYAAWRDLEELYEEGKIRAIGVSNFEISRIIDFNNFNKITPVINQIETNVLCQRESEHRWMKKYNIAHQAYAPLGQHNVENLINIPDIKKIALNHKKTPAQVMLRFLIQNDILVIPKSIHPDRIKENIDIFDFELSKKELEVIKNLNIEKAEIGNPQDPEKVEQAMNW